METSSSYFIWTDNVQFVLFMLNLTRIYLQIQYPNNEWLLLHYRYYIQCDIMAFINVLHYKKQFKLNSFQKVCSTRTNYTFLTFIMLHGMKNAWWQSNEELKNKSFNYIIQ